MLAFLARRIAVAIPTILIISIFVFTLQKLLPGDPVLAMAGEDRDPATIELLRAKYHLSDPLAWQYLHWIGSALRGDLGISLRTREPVLRLIGQKLPVTIQLALMALFFALVIGIPAGVLSAYRKGTWIDWLANITALSGLSIPNFWLGIMMILLVSVRLGWLPASGYVPLAEDPVALARNHADAGLRARPGPRRDADAAYPLGDAGGAEVRLRAHRPRQGAGRARRCWSSTRCATRWCRSSPSSR